MRSWFESWLRFMKASYSFRRLLEEGILPRLSRQLLLAFPDDARHRDRYDGLFSLQTLFKIERLENSLQMIFQSFKNETDLTKNVEGSVCQFFLKSLKRMEEETYSNSIDKSLVSNLVADVLPKHDRAAASSLPGNVV